MMTPAAGDHPAPTGTGGRVVLVGTPLGNLADMAPRGTEALRQATVLACEDTRRTGRLLQHLGVPAPRLLRMDEHTEAEVIPTLLEVASSGGLAAVVSDAGMPVLSDPGGRLVSAAAEAGVEVEVVPGPFAGAAAAALSGLLDAAGRFNFEGFLPRRGAERAQVLAEVAAARKASVLYESPHRLEATVAELAEVCGPGRRVALCRELTKMHEETWRGTVAEAAEHLLDKPPKGEFVVVVEAAPPAAEPDDAQVAEAVAAHVRSGVSHRDAAARVAGELGVAPNRAKRIANEMR